MVAEGDRAATAALLEPLRAARPQAIQSNPQAFMEMLAEDGLIQQFPSCLEYRGAPGRTAGTLQGVFFLYSVFFLLFCVGFRWPDAAGFA